MLRLRQRTKSTSGSSSASPSSTDIAFLTTLGFSSVQAQEALQSCRVSQIEDASDRLQAAVDWLLIKLNEEDLPMAFDPRGMNLEVHSSSGNSDSSTTTSTSTATTSTTSSNTASASSTSTSSSSKGTATTTVKKRKRKSIRPIETLEGVLQM